MIKFKKIIAIFLCVLMLCQMSGYVLADDSTDDTPDYSSYKPAVVLLESLGITEGIHFESQAESFVTRFEFAKLVSKLLNYDASAYSSSASFVDVTEEQLPYVAYVYDRGIFTGTGPQAFSPNEYVTVNQAYIVAMRLLGYDVLAKAKGNTDIEYSALAAKLDVNDGVVLHKDDRIQYKYLVNVLYNALNTPVYNQVAFGNEIVFEADEDTPLIKQIFNINVTEGMVTANDVSALTGKTTDFGTVRIGDNVYDIADTNASELLGYYVRAYYKDDGSKIPALVLADESYFCDIVTYDALHLEYEPYQYIYYENNENETKLKLESNFIIVKNGEFADYDKDDMVPKNGYVTLVDTDSNNKYDTVVINNELIVVAHGYNTLTNEIAFKWASPTDKEKRTKIVLSDYDEDKIKIYDSKGVLSDANVIKENNILTITESNGIVIIYVNKSNVKGKVTEVETEDVPYITVSGTRYRVSYSYVDDMGRTSPVLGDEGTFYLDSHERVVHYAKTTGEWEYTFFIEKGRETGLVRDYSFKLFNDDADDNTFIAKSAKTIYINGVKCTSEGKSATGTDVAEKSLDTIKLVRYKLNADGEVTHIDTEGSDTFATMQRETGSILAPGQLSGSKRWDNNSFLHKYVVGPNTKLFAVSTTVSGSQYSIDYTDVENFEEIGSSYMQKNKSYYVRAYAEDTDAAYADVILVSKGTFTPNMTDLSHGFVMSKNRTLDEKGEEISTLKVRDNKGMEITLYGETEDYVNKYPNVEEGDIVIYNIRKGKVDKFYHVYDRSKDIVAELAPTNTIYDWYAMYPVVVRANIDSFEGGLFKLSDKGENPKWDDAYISMGNVPVMLCTKTGGRNTYALGNKNQIADEKHYGVSSDAVFIISEDVIRAVYIYDAER